MRSSVCLLALAGFLISCSEEESPPPPTPKFSTDVAPLLSTGCALAACHSSKESNLNFFITYDRDQIWNELMGPDGKGKPSPTCPSWRFITPGKPDLSMVMVKMDGNQSRLPQECGSARKSEMPPYADTPNDSLLPKEDRDVIRRWIAAGAPKDF